MVWSLFRRKSPEGNADLLGDAVRVMSAGMSVNFDFAGFADRHIFNKLSKKSEYGFYYYPYGYLFRHVRWGTVNEMGFRIKENFPELKQVLQDKYRIGFFGGSTGYDVLVPDHEAAYQLLEDKLNADAALCAKVGKKFRVINLSQPGNMMLNQIINYIMFGHQLNLDLVISHNPVNDFATKQMNDPNLVGNYNMGYCDVLEAWGRKIHNADDVDIDYLHAEPSRPDFKAAPDRTPPETILRSFHYRLGQFSSIVRGSGAQFVNGFQPWITSKKNLSASEQEKLKSYNPFYQRVYGNVPDLYDRYAEQWLRKKEIPHMVDLHGAFANLSSDVTHFGDVCHLLKPGNEIVSDEYHRAVRKVLGV